MNHKTFASVTGIFFLLVGVLHALRLIFGWSAIIGGIVVPLWASAVAIIIAAYLAYQGLKMSRAQ